MNDKEYEQATEYGNTWGGCCKCGIGSMFNSRIIETGVLDITIKELYCNHEGCLNSIPCGINNLTLKQYP